ncbi:MAG: hypothetical protein V1914_02980 [archaeon]
MLNKNANVEKQYCKSRNYELGHTAEELKIDIEDALIKKIKKIGKRNYK